MKKNSNTLTPMMVQYRQAKKEIPSDAILLFRMGDFYELFFEDAMKGSQVMGITLTKRCGVPMAGIPHHALPNYLPKILEAGLKVAIAEQVEDPKTATGLVKRKITQIISPGTVVDGNMLSSEKSNFLTSICPQGKQTFGLAGLDISTGDFRITQVSSQEQLETELQRLKPAECILPNTLHKLWEKSPVSETLKYIIWTSVEDWRFDPSVALDVLTSHFKVASMDGFGCREYPIGLQAAGAVLDYIENNLCRKADHINVISPYCPKAFMIIDRITQRNLELVDSLFPDNKKTTLLSVIDQTITPMGSRLMREWITRPLTDLPAIILRRDAVGSLMVDQILLEELRETLMVIKDIERTITRLHIGSGNARDLILLQHSLEAIPGIKSILRTYEMTSLTEELEGELDSLPEIHDLIAASIHDHPPMSVKEAGFIQEGYHAHLDELRQAASEGKKWIADLQSKERSRTGIRALKIRFNKVFGYYIEVRKNNIEHVPEDYIRKQTLVNAERFITPELKEIEDKIIGSEDKAKALEYEIFQKIRNQVVCHTKSLQRTARSLAQIDVLQGLAQAAIQYRFTKPEFTKEPKLDIRDGRHPVIEALQTSGFTPNDTRLPSHHIMILTGPNMAGKSTYIRQVALIVLMAQMGGYVPATSAEIGLVDRIFTRIGAADDLARGQSTFMVEMAETANILHNATENSLIILDEIGRGTSTFDGISIAWAVTEYLHNHTRGRTLFATHYHELTRITSQLPNIRNISVAVSEEGHTISFLHKIIPGAADKSYGIHVARLAGLPTTVLERAESILNSLEKQSCKQQNQLFRKKNKTRSSFLPEQLSLFE